ncbi:MAG TPA: MoaD/ThiS family protein [Dehalococcoidales bacterium]|nr:MoaD/ThiS family protein [Dehalococcoidales bacterium]
MSVAVYLPPSIQALVNGIRQIQVEGNTVGDCLEQVIRKYPQLREVFFGPDKTLNKKLSYFVNSVNAYPEILKKSLSEGDKLYIMDILVGG